MRVNEVKYGTKTKLVDRREVIRRRLLRGEDEEEACKFGNWYD